MSNISLAAEKIFTLFGLQFTNTFLSAILVSFSLIAFSILATRKFTVIPGRIQSMVEIIIEFMLEQLELAFGSKEKAKKFLPWLITFLVFITIANQFSLVPLVGQIVANGKPVFRTATSDLSLTVALGLCVVLAAHAIAFAARPLKHLSNFFPVHELFKARTAGEFFNACLSMFLGFLDVIGEFAKIMSLSFRLFGNIFAGEVIIAIIAALSAFTSYIVPIPFLALSIFSGFVQAFVFTMLATQFIAATLKDSHESTDTEPEAFKAPIKLSPYALSPEKISQDNKF